MGSSTEESVTGPSPQQVEEWKKNPPPKSDVMNGGSLVDAGNYNYYQQNVEPGVKQEQAAVDASNKADNESVKYRKRGRAANILSLNSENDGGGSLARRTLLGR